MGAIRTTFDFQAEVKQLLHLMIYSLYSNKEIFLRELISNASDALDKLRFEAVKDKTWYGDDTDLKIQVLCDPKAGTITVKDNGIGMSYQEVIDNLGTIAQSGTKAYLEQLAQEQKQDASLIGQFGVGFYSAFIVADKVTVKTKRAGSEATGTEWESDGTGTYTVMDITKPERGTEVILHLKDSDQEFLNEARLQTIIRKYSDHISWPIWMPQMDKAKQQTEPMMVANQATALWKRNKQDLSTENYQEFYKHMTHDPIEPLTWAHHRVEGKQHYVTLLFVPKQAPFDIENRQAKHGLKLYIDRVFVMEDAEAFLPQYLRFIKGIVDSSDLPLNVSRELLQNNRIVDSIRSSIIKQTLAMLKKLADEVERYNSFWLQFGTVLKEGIIEDPSNREQIAALLRFTSTQSPSAEATVSLDQYITRMHDKQDKIYYITAQSYPAAKHSPHLEYFCKHHIEVLLLHERIDEWLVNHLSDYQGKPLQSVAQGQLPSFQADHKVDAALVTALTEKMANVLQDKVKQVRGSDRLVDSPACLVADEQDLSREMQRILKAAGQAIPLVKPILEVNLTHPLLKHLNTITEDKQFADWAALIYDQAVLAEGGQLEEPAVFVQRLNHMLLSFSLLAR